MAHTPKRDRFVTHTTLAVVSLLLLAFAGFAWYWRGVQRPDMAARYAIVGPLTISTEGYSTSARVAVQTSTADAEWAIANQAALRRAIETTLTALDPQQVHAPGGLQALQRQLTDAANQALHTDKVKQMLLTDFILQTGV